jgi:hypothetical protein
VTTVNSSHYTETPRFPIRKISGVGVAPPWRYVTHKSTNHSGYHNFEWSVTYCIQWDRWINLWDPEVNWMQWQREISPPHENRALVFHSFPRSHAIKYEQLTVQQAMHGVCLQAAFHSNYFWCKTHSKYGLSFEAHVFRCLDCGLWSPT